MKLSALQVWNYGHLNFQKLIQWMSSSLCLAPASHSPQNTVISLAAVRERGEANGDHFSVQRHRLLQSQHSNVWILLDGFHFDYVCVEEGIDVNLVEVVKVHLCKLFHCIWVTDYYPNVFSCHPSNTVCSSQNLDVTFGNGSFLNKTHYCANNMFLVNLTLI